MEEDGTRIWVAKRRARLDVWLRWVVSLLNLDATSGDKLWMPRSVGRCLLTRKCCAPHRGHNNFQLVSSDRCPGFFVVATAEEGASLFACPGSQLYVFYIAAEKCALTNMLQMERVIIPAFFVIVGHGDLRHAGAGWEEIPVCAIVLILFLLMYLLKKIFHLHKKLFPFRPVQSIYWKKTMMILIL